MSTTEKSLRFVFRKEHTASGTTVHTKHDQKKGESQVIQQYSQVHICMHKEGMWRCMCNSCVPEHGGRKAMVFEQSLVSIKYAKL